jgi:hypothetical protein
MTKLHTICGYFYVDFLLSIFMWLLYTKTVTLRVQDSFEDKAAYIFKIFRK